jgi:hypothetical protein
MRSRTGLVKRLLLSGATAFSLVGFASPAVFAWDGGNNGGYDHTNGYSTSSYSGENNYNCMMRYGNNNGWNGNYTNKYCMSRTTYSYTNYTNESRCDHQ